MEDVTMLGFRRLIALALSFVASAALAACEAGGPGGPASGGPASGGPASTGPGALASCSSYPGAKSCHFITVTATGAVAFHGTDTVPNQQACGSVLAASAAANGGEVQLSAPVFLTGPTASFTLFLDQYHGPGSYSLARNDASITFLIGSDQYAATGTGSGITALAGADGSVTVRFSKLTSGAASSGTLSGTAQFTCRNA